MRPRLLAGLLAGVLVGLACVLPVSSPAWAKFSFELTVRERQVRVGDTIHVTATIDDDNYEGQPNSRMCLFQMPGQVPPNREYAYDELKVTYSYRAVAGCRKVTPIPDTGWEAKSEFRLRATAPGRLALVSIVEPDGKLLVGEPYEKGQPQVYIGTRVITVDVVDPHSSRPVTSPAAVVALPGSGGPRPVFPPLRPVVSVSGKPGTDGPSARPSVSATSVPGSPAASPVAKSSGAASGGGRGWGVLGVAAAAGAAAVGAVVGARWRRRSRG